MRTTHDFHTGPGVVTDKIERRRMALIALSVLLLVGLAGLIAFMWMATPDEQHQDDPPIEHPL